MSIRPGVCSGCHIEGGGGDLLGVVGFRFDAQEGGVDELELLDERKVDQEVGGVFVDGSVCGAGEGA